MYKTKEFIANTGLELQIRMGKWIESRKHIEVINSNVWCDSLGHYAFIIYIERDYYL